MFFARQVAEPFNVNAELWDGGVAELGQALPAPGKGTAESGVELN